MGRKAGYLVNGLLLDRDIPLSPRLQDSGTVAGTASSLPAWPSVSFIKADPDVRLSLVQDIVKSRDLVASGASDRPKVSEEEMFMAEGFAWGVKAVSECRRLEGLVSRY